MSTTATMSRSEERSQAMINAARNRVHRVVPTPELVSSSRKQIISHVSADLRERLERVKLANGLANELLTPSLEALKKDKSGAARFAALRTAQNAAQASQNPFDHDHASFLDSSITKFANVNPGTNIFVPPWDTHWNVPNDETQFVQGFTDTESTMAVSCLGSNDSASGFGAAGFSLFLSSPVARTVRIQPFMQCDFSYDFYSYLYNTNTRGGFGYVVYEGGTQVVPSQSPEMWDRTGQGDPWTHIDGSARITSYMPNGEGVPLIMVPGETYQVWVWLWGHADQSGEVLGTFGDPVGSFCKFQMSSTLAFISVVDLFS